MKDTISMSFSSQKQNFATISINGYYRSLCILLILMIKSMIVVGNDHTAILYIKSDEKIDSVKVVLLRDFVYGQMGTEEFLLLPDQQGHFYYKIEELINPAQVEIIPFGKTTTGFFSSQFVKDGDSVVFNIVQVDNKVLAQYSGRGGEKCDLSDKLKQLWSTFVNKQFKNIPPWDLGEIQHSVRTRFEFFKAGLVVAFNIIDSYNDVVSPDMIELLKQEQKFLYFGTWELHIREFFAIAQNQNQRIRIGQEYLKEDAWHIEEPSFFWEGYINYLLLKTQTRLYFFNPEQKIAYVDFYYRIKSDYAEKIRDKLIANFFFSFRTHQYLTQYSASDYQSCLSDAIHVVKDNAVGKALFNTFLFTKGAKVFNFSLKNIEDEMVSLESLLGKLTLIEVWGSGCTGCAEFFKRYKHNISPKINSDSIQVISISIDKDKAKWMANMRSGKFTDSTYINLYTSGKGMDDPFIKYYEIQAIPFIILVDREGNIYSKIEISMNEELILNLIKNAYGSSNLIK